MKLEVHPSLQPRSQQKAGDIAIEHEGGDRYLLLEWGADGWTPVTWQSSIVGAVCAEAWHKEWQHTPQPASAAAMRKAEAWRRYAEGK